MVVFSNIHGHRVNWALYCEMKDYLACPWCNQKVSNETIEEKRCAECRRSLYVKTILVPKDTKYIYTTQ